MTAPHSCYIIIDSDGYPLAAFSTEEMARGQVDAYEGCDYEEAPLDVAKTIKIPDGMAAFKVFHVSTLHGFFVGCTAEPITLASDWAMWRLAQTCKPQYMGWHNATDSPSLPLPATATRESPMRVSFCYAIARDAEHAVAVARERNARHGW